MVIFTTEEMSAVKARYPRLGIEESGVVEGAFDLHAIYGGEERRDEFQVRVDAPPDYPNSMPSLRETGGRTEAIARKHGIEDLRDLHRNPGGRACVCVKQEERRRFPRGADLPHFIEELVVPYLFGLSHFDETANGRGRTIATALSEFSNITLRRSTIFQGID